jgi:voltage-gated sodium channel
VTTAAATNRPVRVRIAVTCRAIVGWRWFDPLILLVILGNAVALGLETYEGLDRSVGHQLFVFNEVVLVVFTIEVLLRLGSYAERPLEFFRNGWNVFDFIVVAASFAPGIRENATLLRLIRLLRVLRAVRLLPDLRVVIVALGRSIPGVASLAVITLLLVYVYGMIGWVIFNDHDPANFGDIGQAMVTMFVLLTLENLPVYIERGQELSDWTLVFFVSYALIAAFLIFNLFIGIVINSMEEARALELKRSEKEPEDIVIDERLRTLRSTLDDLEIELRAERKKRRH